MDTSDKSKMSSTNERCVIGLDIGGTNIKAGIVSPSGGLYLNRKEPTSDSIRSQVTRMLRELGSDIEAAEQFATEPAAVGVAATGVVNTETGAVAGGISGVIDDWIGTNLRSVVRSEFDGPVVVENDANAAALGEYYFGQHGRPSNLVGLTIGTGIGGGMVVDGDIYRTGDTSVGHIGHMNVNAAGRKCACGDRGCLEAHASSAALVSYAREEYERLSKDDRAESRLHDPIADPASTLTAEQVGNAAKNGDDIAQTAVTELAEWVGLGIANIINLVSPRVIVIGGGVSNLGPMLLEQVRDTTHEHLFYDPLERFAIETSDFESYLGVRGAGALAYQYLGVDL